MTYIFKSPVHQSKVFYGHWNNMHLKFCLTNFPKIICSRIQPLEFAKTKNMALAENAWIIHHLQTPQPLSWLTPSPQPKLSRVRPVTGILFALLFLMIINSIFLSACTPSCPLHNNKRQIVFVYSSFWSMKSLKIPKIILNSFC